jgi:hypothetical protein
MVCSILGCAQARSVSGSPPLNHERVFAGTHAYANLGFLPVSQKRYHFRKNSVLRVDIRAKNYKTRKEQKKQLNSSFFNTNYGSGFRKAKIKKNIVHEKLSDHWSLLLKL